MMRRERAKRGEMLVETIVAFAVLMVLLTLVTTVVRGALVLNNRATERLNALALDCARVESTDYTSAAEDDDEAMEGTVTEGTLTLTLEADGSNGDASVVITEDLQIYEGSELRVFHLKGDNNADQLEMNNSGD